MLATLPEKSLRIKWTHRALARLDHIGAYIARHDPGAASRVIIRIRSIMESLPDLLHTSQRWPKSF
ncbi:type II toxin-antitoxin system RelE/ParE family toxin [Rhizobium etli]|uniref:type II toxin-antitoxin system RelE/ParE family toxin n=1 Tax=Rhizobium etli TaxID=29449 RepID=UPI001621A4DF|nr:type II toxin-antitoxin system RelE/ParE family toxin [Rhizobium etli]